MWLIRKAELPLQKKVALHTASEGNQQVVFASSQYEEQDANSLGSIGLSYVYVPLANIIPVSNWVKSGTHVCGPFTFGLPTNANNLSLSMYIFDDQFPLRFVNQNFNHMLLTFFNLNTLK